MKVSLVVPCYNEENNVGLLYETTASAFANKRFDYEIVFVNDGSKDNTYAELKRLFKEYKDEQFLAMYGMLTGTASTGIMLLREVDGDFITPVADNLVYQNFPAIAFGFPMMLIATLAPKAPIKTLIIFLIN